MFGDHTKKRKNGILNSKETLPSSMAPLHQACVITSLVYLRVWISYNCARVDGVVYVFFFFNIFFMIFKNIYLVKIIMK